MNTTRLLALGVLALAAGSAFADSHPAANAALTRAEVAQSVIAARAAGQLRPAGESDAGWLVPTGAASTLSRASVRSDVIAARDAGQLRPAGEGEEVAASSVADTATALTRSEVKAATLHAREAGELIPAGEVIDESSAAREARAMTSSRVAFSRAAHLLSFASR